MKINKGFTLIELIMVIVITAIIAAIAGSALYQGFKSYITAEAITPLTNKGSAALSQLNVDLSNAVSFTTIGAQSLVFVNTSGETITYAYSSNTLTRQVNAGSANTVTDQLTSLTFTYYTSGLATTATPSAVRLVVIQMTITGSSISLINSVFPRNA
jgi:prepilin-type N-terminal cleavage/methylation domain-containing protein